MSTAAWEPPPPSRTAHRGNFADATPAQVRAALIPEEAAEFDQQWREAMETAKASMDLTDVHAVLESWRRIAWMTTAGGPDAHRDMYRKAATRWDGAETPADEPLRRTKERLGL